MGGWIGVDLDGTLAHYNGWQGELHIGDPIWAMVSRINIWLAQGIEVRVFTARVCQPDLPGNQARASVEQITAAIQDWTELHIGVRLPVTNLKDFGMVELWDDRAVRVMPNLGEPCCNLEGPTPEAYDAACKALWHHREQADKWRFIEQAYDRGKTSTCERLLADLGLPVTDVEMPLSWHINRALADA